MGIGTKARWTGCGAASALCLWAALLAPAQNANQDAEPAVLDRVVAIVNHRALLASDIDDQIRLIALEPTGETLTPARALESLISQMLIAQQIRKEEEVAAEATDSQLAARLSEIRAGLPGCKRAQCSTESGWIAFLTARGLTPTRVAFYLKTRTLMSNFIEQRFRAGIRIDQEEIQRYYQERLLPQYAPGEKPPELATVSKRIEMILLEEHVNALFDDWLSNLHKEGDIEILDPALTPTVHDKEEEAKP